jgi:hypothetical protein
MYDGEWSVPAPHVDPHFHETIRSVASETGIAARDVHHG